MANQKEIRGRIKSVKTTQQLTKAMKMVAAAKLRRAQDQIVKFRPYATKMKEIMANISAGVSDEVSSPFIEQRQPEKVLIVAVSTNRGLCGAFNTNILKIATSHIRDNYSKQMDAGNLEVLCIGKKAFEFFQRRNYKLVGENHDLFSSISFENIASLATEVMDGFIGKKYDRVDIVYNEFRNVMQQERRVIQLLPVELPKTDPAIKTQADYIFEPGKKEILETLIPRTIKMQFYRAILDSNASEQGARMSAMDTATENANELLKALKLDYNRARQATITKEILEIVGGAEALAAQG